MSPAYIKKGECFIKLCSVKDLQQGVSEPFARLSFSSGAGRQEQEAKKRLGNAGQSFIFDAVAETDTVRVCLFDKDILGKETQVGECTIKVGGEINEFEGLVELQCPECFRRDKSKRVQQYGYITVKWMYNMSKTSELFTVPDDDYDSDPEPDSAMVEHLQVRLLAIAYRAAVVFFWFLDNLMWENPFAGLGQVLLVFTMYFYTSNGIDALLPSLLFVYMYWANSELRAHGPRWYNRLDWHVSPPLAPRSTTPLYELRKAMPAIKKMVDSGKLSSSSEANKALYAWCNALLGAAKRVADIFLWQRRDVASVTFRVAGCVAGFVWFFGAPVSLWRHFFVLMFSAAYFLLPVYYRFPVIRRRYGPSVLLASLRQYCQQLFMRVMGPPPTALEAVPSEQRKWDEWVTFHKQREAMRHKFRIDTPPASPLEPMFTPPKGQEARARADKAGGLRVHVLQVRGLPPLLASSNLFAKVFASGHKFKTRQSTNGTWNVSYELPAVEGDCIVKLWKVTSGGTSEEVAQGKTRLMNGTKWVSLFDPANNKMGELRMYFLYLAGEAPVHPRTGPDAQATPYGTSPSSVLDTVQHLYAMKQFKGLHAELKQQLEQNPSNVELLWWLARCCYDEAMELPKGDKQGRQKLLEEGLQFGNQCRERSPGTAEGWKWSAIVLSTLSEIKGMQEQASKALTIKEYAERAADMNPNDATTQHVLGAWHYNVANIPWIAASMLGLKSSVKEALPYLKRSAELDPTLHANCLLLGRAYAAQKDVGSARHWFQHTRSIPAKSKKEEELHKEAEDELKKL